MTTERPVISSVASEDWLPVLESLIEGFNHTLSNRIAALGGISQLLEMGLASRDEGGKSVANEVRLLRDQMELLRGLAASKRNRREPGRPSESLRTASLVLLQHRDARTHKYVIGEEPPSGEPLLLWRADHLRVAILFLLAASESSKEEVRVHVSFEAPDGKVRITATTPIAADSVRGTLSFGALARFATAEGGECVCAAAPGGATALTLELPGLGAASMRAEDPSRTR